MLAAQYRPRRLDPPVQLAEPAPPVQPQRAPTGSQEALRKDATPEVLLVTCTYISGVSDDVHSDQSCFS